MMFEGSAAVPPSQNNPFNRTGGGSSFEDYFFRAAQACRFGNDTLGMHLYLTAYARAQYEGGPLAHEHSAKALRCAWDLACEKKERSIAEYVFEHIEPYLTREEKKNYVGRLQSLVLDRLEEYGVPSAVLQEMNAMMPDGSSIVEADAFSLSDSQASSGVQAAMHRASEGSKSSQPASVQDALVASASQNQSAERKEMGEPKQAESTQKIKAAESGESIRFNDLVGFDEAVKTMQSTGLIKSRDPEYQALIRQLNARHGLNHQPGSDSFIFRSIAREDATRFMAAVLGELNLPAVRMRMEEGIQGSPLFCVTTQASNQPKLGPNNSSFEGPGVLLLEDLDLWAAPFHSFDASEEMGGMSSMLLMSLSRGAREILNLIQSAVNNPEVYVLASASQEEIDPFFFDFLGPLSVVDIDLPTEQERRAIWQDLAQKHPSLRHIDRNLLVDYSVNMPRCDILLAADEAIDEAYQASLNAGHYVEVTSGNLFDKLAAYQPLESEEYGKLEEEVINSFRYSLDSLEDLLNEN